MRPNRTQVLYAISALGLVGSWVIAALILGTGPKERSQMQTSEPKASTSEALEMPDDLDIAPPQSRAAPARPPAPGPSPATSAQPACLLDADCRAPIQPNCKESTCEAGECVHDFSSCDCRSHDDCDDDDPCTRDHCFSRTMACIHMPQPCDDE